MFSFLAASHNSYTACVGKSAYQQCQYSVYTGCVQAQYYMWVTCILNEVILTKIQEQGHTIILSLINLTTCAAPI